MYKYLTRSYVEYLGLERIPIAKRRTGATCRIPPEDTLPHPGPSPYCEGVALDGRLYEREPDGLAYVRL